MLAAQTEELLLHELDQQLCDGTLFCSGGLSAERLKSIAGSKPMVILDPPHPTSLFDTVCTPGFQGAQDITRHLIDCGCRNLAVLGTSHVPYEQCSANADVGQVRLFGCMEALRKAGLSLDSSNVVPLQRWTAGQAYEVVSQRVKQGNRFDGLFCLSDTVAVGAIHALHDHGVRVPQDVRVGGFDGTNDGAYNTPSLTTVAIDFADLAHTMVDLLMSRIATPEAHTRALTAGYCLMVRQSSKPGALR